MARPRRRPSSRWPSRRPRTRTRSTPRPKCRSRCRAAARKASAAKSTRDLTEHVWAGAEVKLTLKAVDDAGQEARSETKTIVLPERPFSNPLARAVIEQRRILALDANQKRRVLDLMDAITLRPEDTFDNMSHYLVLMSARTRLKMAKNDDALRDVVSYLWQIALGIEDGDLSAAEKRLRQAQQALKDALERGASDEEIDKLMKELRTAMNEFLREFAERAQKNPNLADQMQHGQELRQSDIDQHDGPDREPGQVGQSRPGAGAAVAARRHDEQSAGRPSAAARPERPAEARCASRWTSSARSCGASRR